MDFDDFLKRAEKALKANECMTFFCSCSVNYSGRAEAHLPAGDRMIIIKADNTLLVLQPV